MKRLEFFIFVHVCMAVLTFGHAYHRSDAYLISTFGKSSVGQNLVGAFGSAVAWPLYWSVQAQSGGCK